MFTLNTRDQAVTGAVGCCLQADHVRTLQQELAAARQDADNAKEANKEAVAALAPAYQRNDVEKEYRNK